MKETKSRSRTCSNQERCTCPRMFGYLSWGLPLLGAIHPWGSRAFPCLSIFIENKWKALERTDTVRMRCPSLFRTDSSLRAYAFPSLHSRLAQVRNWSTSVTCLRLCSHKDRHAITVYYAAFSFAIVAANLGHQKRRPPCSVLGFSFWDSLKRMGNTHMAYGPL